MRISGTPCCRSLPHTNTLSLALSRWAHPSLPLPFFFKFRQAFGSLVSSDFLSLSLPLSLSLACPLACSLSLYTYIYMLHVHTLTHVNEFASVCCAAVGLRSPGQHGWAHHYGPQNGASMRFSLLLSAYAYTSMCICIYIRICIYKCIFYTQEHLQRYREREIYICTYMHTSTYAYVYIILRIDWMGGKFAGFKNCFQNSKYLLVCDVFIATAY